MATIRDVSKEAGVSRTTVTRVLSEPDKVAKKTRDKVMAAVEKLQYRPNMLSQTFRNKRTNLIVVLVPNIANPLFSTIVTGVEQAAQAKGYKLLLGNTQNSAELEASYIQFVETQLADGVLQLSSAGLSASKLAAPHIRAVNVAGVDDDSIPSVMIDNVKAAETVVQHFIDLGHKHIGLVTGPIANANTKARLNGYKNTLAAADIILDQSLIKHGTFRAESGRDAALELMKNKGTRPTAVFCMNDEMATGFIKGCHELSLSVPGDVSVAGFDNISMAQYLTPSLTTISQPGHQMGHQAFELLLRLIETPTETPSSITLPFEFIQRQSTSALKS